MSFDSNHFAMQSKDTEKEIPSRAYYFDQTYRSKLNKQKFERNPKFAYFNTVCKIKSNLGFNHHDIFQLLFDPEGRAQRNPSRVDSFMEPKKGRQTSDNWRDKNKTQYNTNNQKKQQTQQHPKTLRSSVKEISFEANRHKRASSDFYYERKPRLDDILAEYRKMNKKQRQETIKAEHQQKKLSFEAAVLSKHGNLFNRNTSLRQRKKGPAY